MKLIIKRILLLLFIIGTISTSLCAQENHSYFLHTIEKGQSIYSIASMYGVTQNDIIAMNPGCDQAIYAGQKLRIPQSKSTNQEKETFHTIQQGETLYKLTTLYQISAKDICEANPGLSAENFRIGQVIRIPSSANSTKDSDEQHQTTVTSTIQGPVKSKCREMHKVKRKETIFSVSRLYNITEQELINANPELKIGMKRGQYLCIPYATNTTTVTVDNSHITPPSNKELFRENAEKVEKYSTVKAALLLPFLQDKRMVEYYEGFLLAVDSLKQSGVSIDLYVYNLTDNAASLDNILSKDELKKVNVIFGPAQAKHTKQLADFAKKYDISLVIPFSSKDDVVFNNPNVFQINTPHSYLYSQVYDHFTRQFTNANVILLDAGNSDKKKADFIDGLKLDLQQKGVSYKALPETASVEGLKSVLIDGKDNVFIPTSGSDVSLIKIIPQLTLLKRENPEVNISFFGYPEWQTYTKDYLENFFELDTYFYSSFYTNNLLPSAINFTNSYHRWYSKDMDNSFPKYGMLGFDTGFFFLKGLSQYGSAFIDHLGNIDVRPIQTGFNFQRVNNWGGFVNKKAFFVHFTKDFELIKLDFE